MSSQCGSQNYFQDWCLTVGLSDFDLSWINEMAILSKGYKPNKFESHNFLNPSFTNIQGLCFLESNSLDILAICELNLDGSTDFDNFSVSGYVPLIWRNSVNHIHDFEVHVKEGFPFAQALFLKNSVNSYVFDRLY